MAKEDVKLLGLRLHPLVNRVQFGLNLKSIEYEFIEEKFPSKSDLLLKSNPIYQDVPVLIHGDKPVCDCNAIVQYIDEAWNSGPSILPSDRYDRAIARFWVAYIEEKWYPLVKEVRAAQGDEALREASERVVEGLVVLEKAFEKISKGKSFFGGENIGYIDLALGCYLGWLRATEEMNGVKLFHGENTPRLAEWAERFCCHDAVKGVLPETEVIVELAKRLQAMSPPPK
ncbi:Glutathione transferase [Bertholletia excelsa]